MARPLILALATTATLLCAGAAHAGNVQWSIGINLPAIGTVITNLPVPFPVPVFRAPPQVVYQAPAPVYYEEPAPVYYQAPEPVYYQAPPQVVYRPVPRGYAPAPVVYVRSVPAVYPRFRPEWSKHDRRWDRDERKWQRRPHHDEDGNRFD